MKHKGNKNCLYYNLWAKKYQVPPRRYSPSPKGKPPPRNFKKAQPPENIPLQNSPAPLRLISGRVHTLILDMSRSIISLSRITYQM